MGGRVQGLGIVVNGIGGCSAWLRLVVRLPVLLEGSATSILPDIDGMRFPQDSRASCLFF